MATLLRALRDHSGGASKARTIALLKSLDDARPIGPGAVRIAENAALSFATIEIGAMVGAQGGECRRGRPALSIHDAMDIPDLELCREREADKRARRALDMKIHRRRRWVSTEGHERAMLAKYQKGPPSRMARRRERQKDAEMNGLWLRLVATVKRGKGMREFSGIGHGVRG